MTLYWFCNKCQEWFRTIEKCHEFTDECFLCRVAEFEGLERSKMGVNIDFEEQSKIRKHQRRFRIYWQKVARGEKVEIPSAC